MKMNCLVGVGLIIRGKDTFFLCNSKGLLNEKAFSLNKIGVMDVKNVSLQRK